MHISAISSITNAVTSSDSQGFKRSGPYLYNGNYYVFWVSGAATGSMGAYKASTLSGSWTEQDSSNRPVIDGTNPVQSMDVVVSGSIAYIVASAYDSTISANIIHCQFDMSSDTWVEITTGDRDKAVLGAAINSNLNGEYVRINRRSDGDLLVTYNQSGTPHEIRCAISTDGGSTFGTPITVSGTGSAIGHDAILGSSDRLHICWTTGSNGMLRTLLSNDTFGHTEKTIHSGTVSAEWGIGGHDGSGGCMSVVTSNNNTEFRYATWTSADDPTVTPGTIDHYGGDLGNGAQGQALWDSSQSAWVVVTAGVIASQVELGHFDGSTFKGSALLDFSGNANGISAVLNGDGVDIVAGGQSSIVATCKAHYTKGLPSEIVDLTSGQDPGNHEFSWHRVRPFQIGSSYYQLVAPLGGSTVRMYKSTNPTSSWTEQDSSNRPALSTGSIVRGGAVACALDQNSHIVAAVGNDAGTSVMFCRFNTSTDLWSEITTGDRDKQVQSIAANTESQRVAIYVQSGGNICVTFMGDTENVMGSKSRVDASYSTDGGATWNAMPYLSNSGVAINFENYSAVLGEGNRAIALIGDATNDDMHVRMIKASLSASPPYESWTTAFDTAIAAHGTQQELQRGGAGVSYDASGTIKVRFPYMGDPATETNSAKLNSPTADTGTTSASSDQDITGAEDNFQGTTNAGRENHPQAVADGTDLYYLIPLQAGSIPHNGTTRIMKNANDAGWSAFSQVELFSGFYGTSIYTRSGNKVLAFVYRMRHSWMYDEYVLEAAAAAPFLPFYPNQIDVRRLM